MRDHQRAERIIRTILAWAKEQPKIRAMALVGSYARGTARAASDIDLVALTTAPDFFRADTSWQATIDWDGIGDRILKRRDEDYGPLRSRRLWLEQNQAEVEFGFALPTWADVGPLDPGTRRVIADGCRILHDPEGRLTRLCVAVKSAGLVG